MLYPFCDRLHICSDCFVLLEIQACNSSAQPSPLIRIVWFLCALHFNDVLQTASFVHKDYEYYITPVTDRNEVKGTHSIRRRIKRSDDNEKSKHHECATNTTCSYLPIRAYLNILFIFINRF